MDWFLSSVCRCPWIRLQLPLTLQQSRFGVLPVSVSYLALKIANRAAHGLFPFLLILSLECLFTSQEENGCYGAEALDVSKLQGKRLINLDGCEGTNTYVSSFRSDLVKCEKTLRWSPPPARQSK